MSYAYARAQLTDKALHQGHSRIAFRDRVNLHYNYYVYLHTTYVWVRQRDWKALDPKLRLDPSNYFDTRDHSDKEFCYAIPVPDAPIFLRLSSTDIVEMHANGNLILRAKTWYSYTTKKWMDYAIPGNVHIGGYRPNRWSPLEWAVRTSDDMSAFYDGITLDREGHIITKIRPITSFKPDPAKAKEFHAAAKHFRKLCLPWVMMVDGCPLPNVVLDALKHSNRGGYMEDNERLAEIILSRPESIDPVNIVRCMYTPAELGWKMQYQPDAVIRQAEQSFMQGVRRTYLTWVKRHALIPA